MRIISDENLQYDINKAVTTIFTLSADKLGEYQYLTGKKILPPQQYKIIEKTVFPYSILGKALEKQAKTMSSIVKTSSIIKVITIS